MLPPSYLDQMPDAFVQLWQQIEEQILQDVARRIGKMDKVTATANWQLWRYQQTEALRNDVVKLLAKYTGSRQDLVQNANKNQIPIETALIGILRAMLWAAKNLLGAPVDPESSISVNWDDSYIVSEAERTSQLREDALAGLVPRCRYLSARYSLSEEEAHQWTEEAKADSHTDEALTFGGA